MKNSSLSKRVQKTVEEFAYQQSEEYLIPPVFYLDISRKKGQWLAEQLKADKDVVLLGTLLMDCQLGVAIKHGKQSDHIEMSAIKAEEILSRYPDLDLKDKENILACIRQHHGAKKFYSLEAEICCNADCYRFASVEGFLGGLRYTRDMPLMDLMKLLSSKADEKWNALSFKICKDELKPQYELIREIVNQYESQK